MLLQRSQHAKAVADVYTFAASFLRSYEANQIFQIPVSLFLQELLSYQEGFSKHYADSLDGCGLAQEGRVRESYYSFIRRLTEALHSTHRQELDKKVVPAYEYTQACLLHLLDVDWQPYDLTFITEVNLPTLYLNIAKETVKMRECTYGTEEEENEMKEYEKCMKWFEDCSNGFEKWYDSMKKEDKDEKKAVQMFVARFCDLLDVEVSCDGCDVTLPGRRYRCLQCEDMDLCATCYVGGVKPEGEHTHDHDMVHLVYKCNNCQAFIVGTRIHCNVCEDFDLCFGCHEKGAFPAEHNANHDITKFPLIKLKTSQDSDSMIQSYIHQHVWLLFTILAMSTGDIIHPEQPQGMVDHDYVKLAEHLQSQCMEIATHCLKQVPDDAEDSSKIAQGDQLDMRAIQSKQEEAFAIHTQERIMGLLGAMIPREEKITNMGNKYNFTTKEFIQLLFKIARGETGHEVNTRHLAMGLLGPLLTKCDLEVSDQAVESDSPKDNTADLIGWSSVKYLFSFGADCLEKCGLEWACSVSRILQSLYCSPDWRTVILHHLRTCVQNLTSEPDLPAIFALFVMAGFPEVLTIGSIVQFNHTSMDRKTGVVLKHYPDRYQTLIVEIKTRKRYTIQDKYVDCHSSIPDLLDSNHLSVFVSNVKTIVLELRADKELTPETVWVMSLCLKVLNKTLKSSDHCISEELFDPGFIQCLVYIASKGTEFSQQWLLKDLEVLSLMLFTNEGSSSTYKKGKSLPFSEQLAEALEKHSKASKEQNEASESATSDEDGMASDSDSSSLTFSVSDNETEGKSDVNKVFGDLDEKTKVMFETLHSDLKLPLDVLRVIYDMNNKNPDDVVKAIVENLERSARAKEDIKRLSQKWESIVHAKTPEAALASASSDKIIDTGIHYHPVFKYTNRCLDKASEEEWVENQKLIQTPDNDLEDDIQKTQRSKSAELLKQELEKQGRKSSREYIYKVNMAMSVLYARQVLTSLLAKWPAHGPVINTELLGCKDIQQIPCVLDLLNKSESKSRFQMVVDRVVHHCERESLIPIASTAGQFMEEVTLSSITKESPHDYKEDAAVKEKIQLPGASCLRISFDNKCSLKGSCDSLVFSSTCDLLQNKHEFSMENSSNWASFQIPGDTVYYEFCCTTSKDGKSGWGYKFTVTAGTRDSFETGYAILNKVLSTDLALSLPLKELWEILVYVSTKQTGQQRLKAIQLLLKIIHTQASLPPDSVMDLDLGLLKPLWIMYNNSTKSEVMTGTLVTPVIRALTELFLQVESLAMDRGIVTQYLLAIQDIDEIRKVVGQGIMNVAAIGIMINYPNYATELVTLMKNKKKQS
ncbi:hypothetical protein FSP39_022268 [Pinctada imbricata]|uniref:ZZ-type domain-containing protein n=1 Tax=Pinctada imbricata TaxID=66713 RepID=A0AA88XU21_PINIB|nr:hypothetical protein FSP39_022268 [Pinctada imbricata]